MVQDILPWAVQYSYNNSTQKMSGLKNAEQVVHKQCRRIIQCMTSMRQWRQRASLAFVWFPRLLGNTCVFGSELCDLTGTSQEANAYPTLHTVAQCSSTWFPPKFHKKRKTTAVKYSILTTPVRIWKCAKENCMKTLKNHFQLVMWRNKDITVE